MKKRSVVSEKATEAVLVRSRRRCALCYAQGDIEPKTGNLAHIVPNVGRRSAGLENLVFLCAKHNAQLDGSRWSPAEITAARETLYRAVEREQVASTTARVFVAHGRDDVAKLEVLTFLADAGLEAVALADQPNLGQSVLEKLDQMPAPEYVVVVLAPTDWATSRGHSRYAERLPVQNSILELGFFMGRFGRRRVCALYKPPLELPSDMLGALYLEMDHAGSWRSILARELQEAGLPIDTSSTVKRDRRRTPRRRKKRQ